MGENEKVCSRESRNGGGQNVICPKGSWCRSPGDTETTEAFQGASRPPYPLCGWQVSVVFMGPFPPGIAAKGRAVSTQKMPQRTTCRAEAELMHGGTTREIPSPAMWVGLSLKPRAAEPSALNSSLDDIWDISSQVSVTAMLESWLSVLRKWDKD